VVDRYWSDYNYSIGESNAPAWMCSLGVSEPVSLGSSSGNAGTCQWFYTNS
jgi:hypothetical protein